MEKTGDNLQYFGLKGMHSPFLIEGMNEALKRIATAINNREKIVLYGYCDVDSIISMSIMLLVLQYLNADVEYFIPDDFCGSYEVNASYVNDKIKYFGANLLITIGCGVNSKESSILLKKLKIDTIVVDYHEVCNEENHAIVVNPNSKKSKYPFKEFCVSGIVFKLCEAISMYYQMKSVNKYLDLTAIGTVHKCKELSGENKIMVDEGIRKIQNTNNYGIKALMKLKSVEKVNVMGVSILAKAAEPTVNAVGKIDNARIIVQLFTTADSYKAEQIAKYLNNEFRYNKKIF
ncbi:DHH family phosphoesterase [Clostridium felsineum]|uniref:Single-stranded-DNA-specific exonuclease RecJ n=1 Tax=Clostridium felsineum TaxID=36839 RepID=A0A1S8MI01_9CLOT|nr:DHH family phosphoesterase [Clostridium felsineum]MCR3759081.1 DHH family phosphoesterase [Clostridium felsineum]URZ00220.1 Single-stranded-DNA-specific exonuclease RecJ [Clostridium felsineum]URZ07141.1 Single-stranded-DNA-specific exonuclease RecJ [Clostridium felsineum]URZ12171.1 Single-stranded-DNA-specific exonuclease RecJ [Clostridium felsineum]URZ16762.1 Single-stranded-DNA-specific exonuclease RecJ [Clostridium felsineum DSM 794]